MTHFFLSEQGQSDLCRHLDDIPEVVGALAGELNVVGIE